MHKFEECEDCYFCDREPAICDECQDGEQFQPLEPDDDAFDILKEISAAPMMRNVIRIARFSDAEVRKAIEERELEAA